MSYIALYRKYRPKTFDEVYGQSAIVQTLKNQITSNRIGHAYLFSGPRGTGKTSIAKIFAKAINCLNSIDGNPCLTCDCCVKTQDELNVDIIEIDAASNNGVDNIRDLIEESKYMPQYGKYKVYIIDEVHMLSSSAFNALLKTLEEPTPNTVFILATTEEHKVPRTIYSRCQRFQFKLINDIDIAKSLQDILLNESIEYDDDALYHIAKLAKGGLRDAISLLDQCIGFANGTKVTIELVREVLGEVTDTSILSLAKAIQNSDVTHLLDLVNELVMQGKNLSSICTNLYDYYKEEYFYNPDVDSVNYQRYMRIVAELAEKLKYNNNRMIFEIEMIKLCKPQMETDYTSLYQRIQQLENIVEQLLIGNTDLSIEKKPEINPDEFISIKINCCKKLQTEVYYI